MNIIVTCHLSLIVLPSQVRRSGQTGAAIQITYRTSCRTLNNLRKYEGKEGSRGEVCEREVHSKWAE